MHFDRISFLIGNVSPVIADSSAVISLAYSNMPSAGISDPFYTMTKSPTNSSD